MRYDICFLDVVMPGMDGIELAVKSMQLDPTMRLIFFSSYIQYACEGYEVFAFAYILKSRLDEKWEGLMLRLKQAME